MYLKILTASQLEHLYIMYLKILTASQNSCTLKFWPQVKTLVPKNFDCKSKHSKKVKKETS